MSDAAGTDNPAFASEDECGPKTENGGQQQVTLDQDRKSSSADCAPVENGQRSFISQHYVEPVKAISEPCYKTETRIELPDEKTEKSVPEPKLNGIHENGNNNDASFLNNSTTSVQINESGKKEQIEAVNLELVSMRPYTGNNIQTKGQEACEVPADPYEEYFVPVNEHRKYIRGPEAEVETTVAGVRFDLGPGVGREGLSLRDPAAGLVDYSHWLTALRGEKLYVTKDKRSRNSYWKQLLCGLTILVVVIAMIIIILAATGVIFAQEPTEPLENVKDPPLSTPFLTSTFPPWPTTDETLYQIIPDALNGILQLDDFNWSNDFSDTKSRVYREVTAEIEEHLGNILQRENKKPIIKVYNINNEGEIKFRISHPPMDNPKENQEYIKKILQKNNNMIGRYHLNRLQVENLIDQCEHGNLQCAESCKYDYSMSIFMCTCSPEKILDQDGKTCVDNDLSNVEMDDVMPQSSTESIHDFVQGRSRDPNTAQFEIRHSNMWENSDPKIRPAETSTSESKMEVDHPQLEEKSTIIHPFESTPTTKHNFENHEHLHHSMETIFEEPAVEPESTAEPEPTADPEPIAEPEPTTKPEPTAELEPTAEPEPTVEPEPTAEPSAESEPAAETEPTVKLIVPPKFTQSELNVESELTSESVLEFSTKSEIVPKIESVTEAESITERKTATESVSVTESTTIDETDDAIPKTESHYPMSTESHLKSNTEIFNQPKSTVKSMSHNDAESTQMSLLEDANTTNVPKSLADSLNENNNSEIDKSLITTMKTNEYSIDDNISLQVIPLTSTNKSIDKDVEIKMESTTMQSYTNEDDKINESTTIETSFTTLNYEDLKQNNDENIISNKSQNHENSNTEQFTQNPFDFREEKENDSTTEINRVNLSDDFTISKELDSTTVSTISVENRTELITKTMINDKHSHTIEINGINNKNEEIYNNSKVYEMTMIPETTYTDTSTQSISVYQKEHSVSEYVLQSNTQDSNEKNVIEYMPTTVFPKVPKNFAHNVEPLKEPMTMKPPEDEHIMLISKAEEPVEIHAIIPQLIPEQSQSTQNESLKIENSTEINNRVVINKDDLNTKKSIEDIFSIDSSTMRNDKNIVHTGNNGYTIYSDEVQHSTNHPLHPAILPENSVNHFAGKSDTNDDRQVEDMSPFLPDIHKEKENAKKAPRLDKDEQDVPNPFETHIDDVITHRPLIHINADDVKHIVNETESKDLLNDINLYSVNNERKTDITDETTKIIETNAADDVKNIIRNDLNMSEIVNDTESKIYDTLHQNNNFAKLDNLTKDAINQKNSNSSVIKEEEDDDKALKTIASMIEDKTADSFFQTTMQPTDNKTSESVKDTTIITEKKVEDLGDSVIESGTTSLEKPEENAVEDQYNDITDESLSKGYRHGDKDIPIKVVEGSKKAILNDPIISYNRVPSSTTPSDIVKERNETNMDVTQSLNTTVKGVLKKQMEDARLTTQEPVLPMEIQQEMSTTIATDKIEITTVIDSDKREENNREQLKIDRQSDEREADKIAQITTIQSTLETKTTAQVPILPDELQTTENDILTTTSMVPSEEKEMMNQKAIDKTKPQISTENIMDKMTKNITDEKENVASVEMNSTSSERSMTTTMYENNMNAESGREIGSDKNINDSDRTIETSTESAKIETTLMMSATEKNVLNGVERTSSNDVTTTEDIRPVTEMLDDTQPETESYRIFITTPRPILIEPELSEEALRVIPLEKNQESKKKTADKKGFDKYKYKKEKDLSLEEHNENNALTEKSSSTIFSQTEPPRIIIKNYEELNDSIASSDLDPSISRFNLFEREGNVLPILSKNMGNIDESSSIENKEVIMETKPKNYPSFIPVSEEIIEPVPVTEPYIVKTRNYTPTIVSSTFETEESTVVNETAIEGRTNDPEMDIFHIHVRVNETTEQPVTFLSDQSFGDAEEIDRVTKQLSTMRLTVGPTTPMDMDVESATTVVSFSGFAPNAILSKCITGQFQCANGTSRDSAYCVPLSAKCDSKNDCSDGSDELNCEDCSGNFRCASGQCLKRHFACNKIVDCDDGSDERDCENWKCQSDEFTCPSGRCIPASWQCNGRPDCEDYRDEYNCSESCKDNQYLCPTEKWCIPQTWRCNGIAECVNEEDEKQCDCGLDQFKCQTGGCISSIQKCDGVKNCPDYSDEWNCLITNITAETDINTENNMASEPSDNVPLLKIRQYDNEYRLVCSDGWSEEFSDSYCRTLGFAGAETTKNVRLSAEKDRSEKILRLKTNPNHRLPLVTNLEQVEFCVSDKVVQVSCQEFSCGLHDAEGSTARLSGGTPANDEQWSSVALLKELKHGTACTASIIGPMHALASYSCIYRYKDGNKWQLFAGGDMLKGQSVKNIVPYPQVKYNQFLYNNDIALIELEGPLVFSRNISAVCLPRQPIQRQICVTAGWGFSMNGEINLQQYLKFLSLPTYDSDKCNATSHSGFITEHNICARLTDTDKGPCYNDEGAPLMCASESQGIPERWEIQGLLSYHSRCSRDHPAIFSSLEPALSWLRESVPALQTQS